MAKRKKAKPTAGPWHARKGDVLSQERSWGIVRLLHDNDCRLFQELLDGLVHEHASQLATAVNNAGLKAQLEFLNSRGMTDACIHQYLNEALHD